RALPGLSRDHGRHHRGRRRLPADQSRDRHRLCRRRSEDQAGMSAIPIPDPSGPAGPTSAVPGMKRVRRHKWLTWPVILGAVVVLAWVITAATAQYWAPYDPLDFVGKRLQPPSAQHWFGTDGLGRDVFTRTLYGASHSIPIAVIVVLIGAFIGVALGAIAGFFGGLVDSAIMRAV